MTQQGIVDIPVRRTRDSTSSKTFFKPFCVRAEHSTYLTAPNSRASRSPCSKVMGLCLDLANLSNTAGSSTSIHVSIIATSQIDHGTDDNTSGRGTMMSHFGKPLFFDVFE